MSTTAELEVAAEVELAEASDATLSSVVQRHGPGDGVLTLNVGGKEFITLRSTIQDNPILHTRVVEAECNQEFTKGGAVFIDRDPQYFHLILQHLRNRADQIHRTTRTSSHGLYQMASGSSSSTTTSSTTLASVLKAKKKLLGKKDVLIQLPKETEALRDFYVEVRYFQIRELEALLCSKDWYTRIASLFGSNGMSNPFTAASEAITTARRALLASSGFGLLVGTQNDELKDNVKGFFGDMQKLWRGEKIDEEGIKQGGSKK